MSACDQLYILRMSQTLQTGNIDLQIDIFISHKGRWNMWLAKARSQVAPLQ